MDAFEIRLQFLATIRKLTSSQTSINRVAAFAVKYGHKCADDLWDCLMEESAKANINARMNIFYALDSVLEQANAAELPQYRHLVKRDLGRIVDLVVPPSKEGVLNVLSTLQVLRSWRMKRVLEPEVIEPIEEEVNARRRRTHKLEVASNGFSNFTRNDIFRRIEDDRERHKRLRERIWVLPLPHQIAPLGTPAALVPSPASPTSPHTQISLPASTTSLEHLTSAVDLEFEQIWEGTPSLTDNELELMHIETNRMTEVMD